MDWLITIVIVSLIIYGVSKRKKTENKENEFETELSPTGKKENHSFLTAGIIVVIVILIVVGYYIHETRMPPTNYMRTENSAVSEGKILKSEQWSEYSESDEFESVEFAKLKNFPARYNGKRIQMFGVSLGTEKGMAFGENTYTIRVFNPNQFSAFSDDPYKDGSLVFTISESLFEKVLDSIGERYSMACNLYTSEIYEWKNKDAFGYYKTNYVARIIGVECLE